jgi:spermidine synthase
MRRRLSIAPAPALGVFLALLALLSLPTAARAQDNKIVYEGCSDYQRISVIDTPDGYRQLIFDGRLDGTDAIQSEMSLADPIKLTLPYPRHLMTALPVPAGLERVLIVGLGGACMQRYLRNLLPELTIETVEIDPMVVQVAEDYFFFKEDEKQIVHVADGAAFMAESKDKYDIIFLDAFGAMDIPAALRTQEFFAAVKDRLAEGGVACANLWYGASDYAETVRNYAAVFPEHYIVRCGPMSGNNILLALPVKTDLGFKGWIQKAEEFEKAHPSGMDLPKMLRQRTIR